MSTPAPRTLRADWNALGPGARAVAALICVVCLANMARPVWAPSLAVPPWDFSCFWYAGKAWLAGASPYAQPEAGGAPPPYFSGRPFFYPPSVRPLFEAFALMPFWASRVVFAGLSVAMWAGILAATTKRLPSEWPPLARLTALPVLVSFVLVAARFSVEEGQTAIFVVAAIAGLMGLRDGDRDWAGVAAVLLVLSIKPQLGLPLAIVVLMRWGGVRSLLAASIAFALLTFYGTFGRPDLFIAEFAANVSAYSDYPENAPGATSGLPTILHGLGLPVPSSLVLVGLACVGALAAASSRLPRERLLFLAACVMLFVLPNHRHGYLLLVPMVPIALAAPVWARRAFAGSALVMANSLVIAAASPVVALGDGFAVYAVAETAAITVFAGTAAAWLVPQMGAGPARPRRRRFSFAVTA